ncbi:manganese catalase family protein [Halosimplex pelagicum]|uniref:Manganese catalase family protein n=1 Tax=Halosimplex pelagicum TaxID=869886 RepID=A0A7D5TEB1_9EURY|nr:manganese catalase family protein [Halosimplex pelagicum]QLH83735.1 manganese catalase family protein [Halosimplex pelagicum]
MFYHDDKLQYPVEVEEPDPAFAKMLQEAIGGVEGEMRVCLQYMFQAFGVPDEHAEYRKLLMETAVEEIGHIEMLATAVAKNLEGAPTELREEMSNDGAVNAAMSGMLPRQYLSAGMNAMPIDANGNAFNASYVVASGNLAADMYANVMAESTGRLLAARLWEMTDDPGMKDMLSYLVARDAMHQNQWLKALHSLGDPEDPFDHLPIPNTFPEEEMPDEFDYSFMSTTRDGEEYEAPWTQGPSVDGKEDFSFVWEGDMEGAMRDISGADPDTHNEVASDDD